MNIIFEDKEKRIARQLVNGKKSAMREFYSLYADYLYGVCARYVSNDEDIKDVLQDCLVNVFTHIEDFKYREKGSLKAWITRIAVNQSLKYLKVKRHLEWTNLDWDIPDIKEVDDPPIRDIPAEVIHELIRQLPTGYRTVFNLYVFENKSHEEIATLLNIKKDSSASQLHRAKNLLAKRIEEYRISKTESR